MRGVKHIWAALLHDRVNAGSHHPAEFQIYHYTSPGKAWNGASQLAMFRLSLLGDTYNDVLVEVAELAEDGDHQEAVQLFNEAAGGPNGETVHVVQYELQ